MRAVASGGGGVIFGEHTLGMDGDLTVRGPDGTGNDPMTLIIDNGDGQAFEYLSRSDVERLRDLCDEALA